MATLVKTPKGEWKAVVRLTGWPVVAKTFRVKRDATDWSRATEDEMVRGVFVNRATSHRLSVASALDRYFKEVTPTKRATTAYREPSRIKILKEKLGQYSLVSLTPEIISGYRDERIEAGKAANTVRLELALLSNLFTMAMREWRLGLTHNPLQLVRKPAAPRGRERRLRPGEEAKLLEACDKYSNPMLGWIVRVALYTGMRLGEIVSLTVSQVDLERRVVRLTETKNGGARTVPLSKAAVPVLQAAIDNPLRKEAKADLVFFGSPRKDGKKRGYYRFEQIWR
ncbi:MAG: integrase, partial [Steroidobacteraceae bacterium]